MKQLIVMIAAILLGIYIFGLIAGSGEGSVRSTVGRLWQQEIAVRTAEP